MPNLSSETLRPHRIRSAEELAHALQRARKARGLTQTALAKLAAILPHHISRIESGSVKPNISTLFALMAALDLDLTISARDAVQNDPDHHDIGDIF